MYSLLYLYHICVVCIPVLLLPLFSSLLLPLTSLTSHTTTVSFPYQYCPVPIPLVSHSHTSSLPQRSIIRPIGSGVGTTGALGASAPVNIVVSSACPYTTCSFFTPTSIALSCSAGTDVLSCSVGTDAQRRINSFLCQQSSSVHGECFFLFHGKYIKNSDVSQ